jgi:hypothetical protein
MTLAAASLEPQPELRTAGVRLEMAASTLNGVTGRLGVPDGATAEDFTDAIDAHEFAREEYRSWLALVTGQPASLIERLLSL